MKRRFPFCSLCPCARIRKEILGKFHPFIGYKTMGKSRVIGIIDF